ncbi:MAG: hypothetical protein ACRD32_08955, partial [Nitrososphaerales archaeon]
DGTEVANDSPGMVNITPSLNDLMFEKNGRLTVNLAAQGPAFIVAAFDLNDDQTALPSDATTTPLVGGMTFTELDKNGGVFGNYDEGDDSNLDITATAARGKSATIRYNDVSKSVVVGFGFGSIDVNAPDGEWNSGEEIPVTLVDSDANKNSRADEDLDLFDPNVALIPALKIGSPFTLLGSTDFVLVDGLTTTSTRNARLYNTTSGGGFVDDISGPGTTVQKFSDRAILDWSAAGTITVDNSLTVAADGALVIDLGRDLKNLRSKLINTGDETLAGTSDKRGLNLFNYDIRSINGTSAVSVINIYLLVNTTGAGDTTFDLPTAANPGNGFGSVGVTSDTG